MRKSLLTYAIAAALPFCANAQFVIENNSGDKTTVNGNISFSQTAGGDWQLNGTGIDGLKSISRAPHTGIVELDRDVVIEDTPSSLYFGDNYAPSDKKGIANYYIEISNDTWTQYSNQNIPAHPGGYIVFLDIFGEMAANHNYPVIPEGTYTVVTDGKYQMNTVHNGLSWAIHNTNGTVGGLKEFFIEGGQIVVKHIDNTYDITGDLISDNGETMKIHHRGDIDFLDFSGIDDGENAQYIMEDIDVTPLVANDISYEALNTETYDEHVMRLFTTTNTDPEGEHCMEAGVKLQLSFLSGKDGIAGEYTFGELSGWTMTDPRPGKVYPGLYMGSIASNSFLEMVTEETLAVKTALITGGTLSITDNHDGTHTITGDFTTGTKASNPTYKATINWTGTIDFETVAASSAAPAKIGQKAIPTKFH